MSTILVYENENKGVVGAFAMTHGILREYSANSRDKLPVETSNCTYYRSGDNYSLYTSNDAHTELRLYKFDYEYQIVWFMRELLGKSHLEIIRYVRKKYGPIPGTVRTCNKDFDPVTVSNMEDLLISIPYNGGIEWHENGFRALVTRSSQINNKEAMSLIKSNQQEFVKWVRDKVATHKRFKKKGVNINCFKMSRYTICQGQIVCIFDIREAV